MSDKYVGESSATVLAVIGQPVRRSGVECTILFPTHERYPYSEPDTIAHPADPRRVNANLVDPRSGSPTEFRDT